MPDFCLIAYESALPPRSPADFKFLPLELILDMELPSQYDRLTDNMRSSLEYYEGEAKRLHLPANTIVVCDLCRSPNKAFRPTAVNADAVTPTLTARNCYIWVFFAGGSAKLNRFLHHKERLMLQGFSPGVLGNLTCYKTRVAGNAMTVPAAGVTFACMYSDFKG